MYDTFSIKSLIGFIGCDRGDFRFNEFISSLNIRPLITIDKEDGANDEYVEFKDAGIGFYFENNILMSIFLHSGEDGKGYLKFQEPLPMGMCFGQSIDEVANCLGSPDAKGGGYDAFFGDVPQWVRYNIENYALHIEFAHNSKKIGLVTLMPIKK
jgi:hypothetical protein